MRFMIILVLASALLKAEGSGILPPGEVAGKSAGR
jgi:hypothetical protein